VVWLGGSACAGKSTSARALAATYGLTLYSCDEHFEAHRKRASPQRHPHFHRLMDLPQEALWTQPVATQIRDLLSFYEDELTLVFEDLLEIPGPVIAEGVGLLPARVAAVLSDSQRACWLIATPAFRRLRYPQRAEWLPDLLRRCPDPEQAFADWMARDDGIANHLEAEATARSLAVREVDGRISEQETVTALARQLGLR
jgi:hypothetical protein